MSRVIFLPVGCGGVGDQLICSTLPEQWVREEGHEVWVWGIETRHPDISYFFWEKNPFITGVTQQAYTHYMNDDERHRRLAIELENNIMATEVLYGLRPQSRLPKIYYQPQYLKRYRNTILVDPAAVTVPWSDTTYRPFLKYLEDRGILEDREVLVLLPAHLEEQYAHLLPEIPRVLSHSIEEYCDLIFSCRGFATNHSGSTGLASAIKGTNLYPKIYAFSAQAIINNRVWMWENISYWTTGELLGDFQLV